MCNIIQQLINKARSTPENTTRRDWGGKYHCPDCWNQFGCSEVCNRRFGSELLIKKEGGA